MSQSIFFLIFKVTVNCCVNFCIIGYWTKWPPHVTLCWHGTLLKIPPSSQGCCSLVKQVIVVTKKMYIIHLVLMSLIGLVTFMPVNKHLVSEGNDGCLAKVRLPPSWEIHQWLVPCVCRLSLLHIDHRFRGTSSFQSIISGKSRRFFEDVPLFQIVRMLSCPKKSPTSSYCNGNGCA